MLKQTVHYEDFNGNQAVETLYFNLTKTELQENLHLQAELEKLQESFDGEDRTLTREDMQATLNMVKTFMKLAYGERSADGKRFIKSDELWTEFTQTAVYDQFLFSLFEDPARGVAFMTGIMPSDLRENINKEIAAQGNAIRIPQDVEKQSATYANSSQTLAQSNAPVDVDSLLAQMPTEELAIEQPEKRSMSRSQLEFLKGKLSKSQFEKLESEVNVID